jgi:peptide/nickel transport system permease protein
VFRYLVGRLLWSVFLFLALTMVAYVLFFMIPSDPLRPTRQTETEGLPIRDAYALHGPFYADWGRFVWRFVTERDLGHSVANRQPVTDRIMTAAPVTLSLIFGGMIVWMLIAIPLGILSGLRPRSLLDRCAVIFVLIGISAHPLWLGLILRWFFSGQLDVLPAGGYCNMVNPVGQCGGPVDWFSHLIMPWFAFSLLFAAIYVRMVRASVIETKNEDYVRTARAKGAPERIVIRRHILRNAMLPLVAMASADMAMAIGGPIGGAVVVERVFGLPGVGQLAVNSLGRRDTPMILGVTIWVMVLVLVLSVIADIAYTFVDPRMDFKSQSIERVEVSASGRGGRLPAPAPAETG